MKNIIELTEEAKAEYLNDPHHCPVCGSNRITAGKGMVEFTEFLQDVECDECGAKWVDKYSLVDIVDIEVSLKRETEVTL